MPPKSTIPDPCNIRRPKKKGSRTIVTPKGIDMQPVADNIWEFALVLEDYPFISFSIMILFDLLHDFKDITCNNGPGTGTTKMYVAMNILKFLNTLPPMNNDPFGQVLLAIKDKMQAIQNKNTEPLLQGRLRCQSFGQIWQRESKVKGKIAPNTREIIPPEGYYQPLDQPEWYLAMIHCDDDHINYWLNSEWSRFHEHPEGQCGGPVKHKHKDGYSPKGDPIYYPAVIIGEIKNSNDEILFYEYVLIPLTGELGISPESFGIVEKNKDPEDSAPNCILLNWNIQGLGNGIAKSSSYKKGDTALVASQLSGQIQLQPDNMSLPTLTGPQRKVLSNTNWNVTIKITRKTKTQYKGQITNPIISQEWSLSDNIVNEILNNPLQWPENDTWSFVNPTENNLRNWQTFGPKKAIEYAKGGFFTYNPETYEIFGFYGANQRSEDEFRGYLKIEHDELQISINLEKSTMIEMNSELLQKSYNKPINCYRLADNDDLPCADQWANILLQSLEKFNSAVQINQGSFAVFIDADGSKFRMNPLINMLCGILSQNAHVEFVLGAGQYYDAATDSGVRRYLESYNRRTFKKRLKAGIKHVKHNIINYEYQEWLIDQYCASDPGAHKYKIRSTRSQEADFEWEIQLDTTNPNIQSAYDITGQHYKPIAQVMGKIERWGFDKTTECIDSGSKSATAKAFSTHGLSASPGIIDNHSVPKTSQSYIAKHAATCCDLAYKSIGDLTKIMDAIQHAIVYPTKAVLYVSLDIISAQIAALLGAPYPNFTVILEDKSGMLYESSAGTKTYLSAEGSLIIFNNLHSTLPISPALSAGAGAGAGSSTDDDVDMPLFQQGRAGGHRPKPVSGSSSNDNDEQKRKKRRRSTKGKKLKKT